MPVPVFYSQAGGLADCSGVLELYWWAGQVGGTVYDCDLADHVEYCDACHARHPGVCRVCGLGVREHRSRPRGHGGTYEFPPAT